MTKRLFGYDWLAHEKEFEEEIRRTKDDSEFARTIDRILDLTCDAHTWIASPEYWRAYCTLPPFDEIAGNVPEEAVVYWNELASRGLNEYEIFPALYFEGEYVVVTGLDLAGHLVKPGWVVTQVNGTEVDRFVLEQGVGLRYDPVRHKPYVIALGLPASSKVELTFEDGEGNRVVAEVVPSQENWPENYYRPSYYSSEEGTWVHDSLFMTVIPGVAGYMHFWRMPAFNEEDWASVKEFLSSVKDLPALIIDVRCVPGGVATTWKSLVCLLAREPLRYDSYFSPRTGAYVRELFPKYFAAEKPDLEKENPEFARMLPPEVLTEDYGMPVQEWTEIRPSEDSIGYSGKIFVLVDHRSFSAADQFAYFCKRTGWATVVGTFTQGGGNGPYYCLAPLVLPNSKMVVYFPFAISLEPEGRSYEEYGRMPDVYVADRETFVKYVNALIKGEKLKSFDPEYDAVLRKCLEIIESSRHLINSTFPHCVEREAIAD